MENSTEVSQEMKNRNIIWSRNHTSGFLSKGNERIIWKRHLHSHFQSGIIQSSQGMETTEGFEQKSHELSTFKKVENNSNGGFNGSREISKEATAIVQARDCGS